MPYELKHIKPLHRELARRIALGQRPVDVAHELGMSPEHASIICRSPVFQRELARLEEMRDKGVTSVEAAYQEIAPVALEQLERTMYKTKSESLKTKIAFGILDRAGFGPVSKTNINFKGQLEVQRSELTAEEKRALVARRLAALRAEAEEQKRLAERAKELVIDITPEPEKADTGLVEV